MDTYFEMLQEKAKKINANIEHCSYDKECIKDTLAEKVKTNLENEDIKLIKEKAIELEAISKEDSLNKEELLIVIENKVKEILEKENEKFTSIEVQQNFMPIDLG